MSYFTSKPFFFCNRPEEFDPKSLNFKQAKLANMRTFGVLSGVLDQAFGKRVLNI